MACSVVVFEYFGRCFYISSAARKDASLGGRLRQARGPRQENMVASHDDHRYQQGPSTAGAVGHGSIWVRCPRSGRAYRIRQRPPRLWTNPLVARARGYRP